MTYGEFYKTVCYNCVKMSISDRLDEIIKKENYNIDVKDIFNHELIQYILNKSTERMISDNEELLNSLADTVSETLDKIIEEVYNTVFNKEEENVY